MYALTCVGDVTLQCAHHFWTGVVQLAALCMALRAAVRYTWHGRLPDVHHLKQATINNTEATTESRTLLLPRCAVNDLALRQTHGSARRGHSDQQSGAVTTLASSVGLDMPASKVAEASWILLLSLADVEDRLTAS